VLRTNARLTPLQALRYRDLLQVEDLFRKRCSGPTLSRAAALG
jgi:hypothetical protein